MKKTLKISVIAVAYALGGLVGSGAYALSTVRSLGGGETYSGTASATAAKSSGAVSTAARAGTIRMNPTARATSTTPVTNNNKAGNSSRLSIGKYLGGTGVSGNATLKNPNTGVGNSKPSTSGGNFTADLTAVQDQVKDLATTVNNLSVSIDNVDSAVSGKQDKLAAGEYIYIDQDEVGLDIDALTGFLGEGLGREIEMQATDVAIEWRYVGDSTWQELIALEKLRGPAGEQGETGAVDPDLLKTQVDAAVNLAVANFVTRDEVNTIVAAATSGLVAQEALETTLGNYATKEYVNTAVDGVIGGELTGYVTTETYTTDMAAKADKTQLADMETKTFTAATYATKDSLNDFLKSADLTGKLNEWAETMGDSLGRAVEMQTTETEIQWRYTSGDDTGWKTLIALADLKGDQGETGPQGPAGVVDEETLATAVNTAIEAIKGDFATAAQGSLAESALQPGDAVTLADAPKDGKDYVAVVNNGIQTWVEVIE